MAGRVDKVTDPGVLRDLLLARRGQAYFSRKLKELPDSDFSERSAVPGWSRSRVIAHVGYHARGIARLVEGAGTGEDIPMFESTDQFLDEVEFGSTLTPFALRNLSDHAAVHLTVEWRDLEDDRWGRLVPERPGDLISVARTPWMRACELWIRAVDLGNGGELAHAPAEFVDRLLEEIVLSWGDAHSGETSSRTTLHATDRGHELVAAAPRDEHAGRTDIGKASDLLRWTTGRGTHGVELEDGGAVRSLDRWEN